MDTLYNLIFSNFLTLAGSSILLLFLGVLLFLNKKVFSKITELWKGITKLVKNEHKIDSIVQSMVSDINSDLSAIRGEFSADRAYIFEFHNGSEFASKMPQWKVSQTYEKVKAGITYEGQNLQNIPATLIWDDFLKIFFEDSPEKYPPGIERYMKNIECTGGCNYPRGVYLVDVKSMDPSIGPSKAILEKQGINFMLITSIITSRGYIVGWVGLDFCRIDEWSEIENEINSCSLCRFSSQISLLWEMNKSVKERMILSQKNIWDKYEYP